MEQEGHLAAGGRASNEGCVNVREDFTIMDIKTPTIKSGWVWSA